MVKAEDIMDTHPLERMKNLEDIKTEKKESILLRKKELERLEAEKKQKIEELEKIKKKELEELENKKKELEEIQKIKAKEIEETEELIEKSFQELMKHKILILQEENKKNLEKIASEQKTTKKDTDYNRFFEQLKIPQRIYDVTNASFYNNLNALKEKALMGNITPEEENFIEQLKQKFESFSMPEYIQNKDEKNYVSRSIKIIEEIDNLLAYK